MKARCEERKVSTPEQICESIKNLPGTVCVIIFGVDCRFKSEVLDELEENSREFPYHYYYGDDPPMVRLLLTEGRVKVILNTTMSLSLERRNEIVQDARRAGFTSVAGIFVNGREPLPHYVAEKSCFIERKIKLEFSEILDSNPRADIFDYFAEIRQEKEEVDEVGNVQTSESGTGA